MEKVELNVIELLEYLQDMVESSPKMPITGKTIIDKKEFNEVIDQIINLKKLNGLLMRRIEFFKKQKKNLIMLKRKQSK